MTLTTGPGISGAAPAAPAGGQHPGTAIGDELVAAVERGDHERAAEIASTHIWPLFDRDYVRLVRSVGALPPAFLDRYAVLRIVHPATPAVSRSSSPFDTELFVSRAAPVHGDPQIVRVLQMIAARMSGDISTALAFAKRIEVTLREQAVVSLGAGSPAWFLHHQVASTMLSAGATVSALRELATARQIAEAVGSSDGTRSSAGRAALAHAVRGSVPEAERALDHPQMRVPLSPAYVQAGEGTERTAAAILAVERLAPDAEQRVDDLGELDAVDVVWPFVMLVRARFALSRQQPFDALDTVALASASHVVQAGSFAADAAAALTAEAHLSMGDVSAARSVIDAVARPATLTRLASVRLAVQESDLTSARAGIQALSAAPGVGPGQRAELMLLDAWRESVELGRISSDRALRIADIAASGHHRRVFTSVPGNVVEQIAEALPQASLPAFTEAVAGISRRSVSARPSLTSGELRALRAIREHRTLAEGAAALHVSINTLKTQIRALYRKLGVSSREEAISEASRLAL